MADVNVMQFGDEVPDEWMAKNAGFRTLVGKSSISRAANRWEINSPLIIRCSNKGAYKSVLEIDELADCAFKSSIRIQRFKIFYTLAICLIVAPLFFYGYADLVLGWVYVSALLLFYLVGEYICIVRNFEQSVVRARALNGIYYSMGFAAKVSLVLATAVASIQWLAVEHYGGLEPAVVAMGAVFYFINEGEYWRAVIGPLFHSSYAHGLVNAGSFIAVMPLGIYFSRLWAPLVFVWGCFASVYGAYLYEIISPSGIDALMGVSGGILAVLGYVVGMSLVRPKIVPHSFSFSLAALSLLTVIGSEIVSPASSTPAHTVGFVAGLLVGLLGLGAGSGQSFSDSNEPRQNRVSA